MKLNIQKPLVIFDLETTGLDFCKDRVIQLSYIKVMPDGEEKRVNLTINPLIPIPQFITELTGISDADVADKPSFKELAPQLAEEFKGCDLAGYNSNNFDIPMRGISQGRHRFRFQQKSHDRRHGDIQEARAP